MPGAPAYMGEQQHQMPLLPQTQTQTRELEEEVEKPAPRRKGPVAVMCDIIRYLSPPVFTGLVIYALVVSNTEDITRACGTALWSFMCTRLFFTIFELLLLCLFGYYKSNSDISDNDKIEGVAYAFVCLGVTHIVMLGLGAFYVSQAMNNDTCTAALASVSATNSPLLGILGYIYVPLDGLIALTVIYSIFRSMYENDLI